MARVCSEQRYPSAVWYNLIFFCCVSWQRDLCVGVVWVLKRLPSTAWLPLTKLQNVHSPYWWKADVKSLPGTNSDIHVAEPHLLLSCILTKGSLCRGGVSTEEAPIHGSSAPGKTTRPSCPIKVALFKLSPLKFWNSQLSLFISLKMCTHTSSQEHQPAAKPVNFVVENVNGAAKLVYF